MKIRSTKKELIVSALSLTLCTAMLAGTTLAWFTDSVSSNTNIIQAGTLDIRATVKDSLEGEETDINENNSIFDERAFQPGATGTKYITVYNDGSLAAKVGFDLAIQDPNGLLGKDTEENDVITYTLTEYKENADEEASAVDNYIEDTVTIASNESKIFVLEYKMEETAGNEYQGKKLDAYITILATQTNENAKIVKAYDTETFKTAIENVQDGETIEVEGLVNLEKGITLEAKNVTIKGSNNATIIGKPLTITGQNVTIENITFNGQANASGNASAILANVKSASDITINNCVFKNVEHDAIQIVPATEEEIKIKITNNKFETNRNAYRYIHVESTQLKDGTTIPNDKIIRENVTLEITGNTFNNLDKITTSTGIFVGNIDYKNVTIGNNKVGDNTSDYLKDKVKFGLVKIENNVAVWDWSTGQNVADALLGDVQTFDKVVSENN
jgi:predicted ribosomally synthesized peptide with SipW-like signal peptide